jgi:DNA mismatch repair ATPase MutS
VRQLANIVYWIDAREDLLGRLLQLPMLYTVQCAFAAQVWRKRYGSKLRAWADIAAEMEALLSLASYSYEHPDDPFPEFAEQIPGTPAIFLGEELGHPLIPSAECVRNAVHLDAQTRVLLVSG